jgi:hypothetical protein
MSAKFPSCSFEPRENDIKKPFLNQDDEINKGSDSLGELPLKN